MISIEQKQEYFDFANKILNVNFDPKICIAIASLDDDANVLGVVVFSGFCVHTVELSVASCSPKFLTRRFLNVIFHYAFITAGKRRINAVIEDGNINAIQMDLRLGFVQEAVCKHWYGDIDGILLRMLKEECKWI